MNMSTNTFIVWKQGVTKRAKWASQWIDGILGGHHPAMTFAFAIPSFRLLYKIHKSKLGMRPITGNHVWVTQPLALLLAALLLPYVRATSTYVQDTDDFQRNLSSVVVLGDYFLVTYDVERLYPSIPHGVDFDFCIYLSKPTISR